MTSPSTSARAPWPAAISVPLRLVYGIYAALLFLAVALTALLGVLLMPTLRLRRGTARIAARTFFLLAGMPLRLRGIENLPARPVRGGRQSRQLPRRRGDDRRAAAALRLRDQARDERRAGGRPAAAPHRLGVRRTLQSPQGRRPTRAACCAPRPAVTRWCSFPKAPSRRRSGSENSTPAHSPSRRAPPARWCRR